MKTNVVVIATNQRATNKENAEKIFEVLKKRLGISGLWMTEGQGCYNWGLCFKDKVYEEGVNKLTMVLMPAKWAYTKDTPWDGLRYGL